MVLKSEYRRRFRQLLLTTFTHGAISDVMRFAVLMLLSATLSEAGVVATWLFDEQKESYPSSILNDCGPNGYVIALGRGARMAPGRFGRALEPAAPEELQIRGSSVK